MKARGLWTHVAAAAALVCLLTPAARAQAQVNDAQCLIVSNLFVRAVDGKEKTAAIQASFFYLGRMSGTVAEVEARLAAEVNKITKANNGAIMTACVQAMMARARQLSAVDVKIGRPAGD
jgi:hypothetical protein